MKFSVFSEGPTPMACQSFEHLEVWKRSCRQAVDVYRSMDDCRRFSLKDQIERSSLSVPSNIAEGHERDSTADFIRFLRIAKASNGELRTQLYIATELELLDRPRSREMISESKEISAMLLGLVRSLQKAD